MILSKLNSISVRNIVTVSAIASIIGAIIIIFRVFLIDRGFTLWGLGEPEPWLSFVFLLWGIGLFGFFILHGPENATWVITFSAVVASLYSSGIVMIGFGNPVGGLNIFTVIIIVSLYCLWFQTIGRQSFIILTLVATGLCSLLPYIIIIGGSTRSDSWLNIAMGLTTILFSLSWISLGVTLWSNRPT